MLSLIHQTSHYLYPPHTDRYCSMLDIVNHFSKNHSLALNTHWSNENCVYIVYLTDFRLKFDTWQFVLCRYCPCIVPVASALLNVCVKHSVKCNVISVNIAFLVGSVYMLIQPHSYDYVGFRIDDVVKIIKMNILVGICRCEYYHSQPYFDRTIRIALKNDLPVPRGGGGGGGGGG